MTHSIIGYLPPYESAQQAGAVTATVVGTLLAAGCGASPSPKEQPVVAAAQAFESAVTGNDDAEISFERDTVFLARFPTGWLVRVAGCQSQGDQPYRCVVEG